MYDQIPTKELSTVLKSMGYNPTKEEIQDMVDQVRFDLTTWSLLGPETRENDSHQNITVNKPGVSSSVTSIKWLSLTYWPCERHNLQFPPF